MIYIVWYVILVFSLLIERQAKRRTALIRILIPVLYILLIGLRGPSVGVDSEAYYNHYFIFGQDGCPFVEWGFDWINRFCYHHGLGVSAFFIICAFLTVAPVALVISKFPNKEYCIAALLFYGMTIATLSNGMRQAIAAGIFFFVGYHIASAQRVKYGFLWYVLGVLIASLFHITALILIPLYFQRGLNLKNNIAVLLYCFSFLFTLFDLSSWIPDISAYEIGNREFSRYEDLSFNAEASSRLGFWVSSLPNIIIFFIMLKRNTFEKYPFISLSVLLSFMLKNMAFGMPIIGRVSMYFVWFVYIIIAKLCSEPKQKNQVVLWILVFTTYAVLTIHTFISDQNQLLPYKFVWEERIN